MAVVVDEFAVDARARQVPFDGLSADTPLAAVDHIVGPLSSSGSSDVIDDVAWVASDDVSYHYHPAGHLGA